MRTPSKSSPLAIYRATAAGHPCIQRAALAAPSFFAFSPLRQFSPVARLDLYYISIQIAARGFRKRQSSLPLVGMEVYRWYAHYMGLHTLIRLATKYLKIGALFSFLFVSFSSIFSRAQLQTVSRAPFKRNGEPPQERERVGRVENTNERKER